MYPVSKKTHAMESADGRLRWSVGQHPRARIVAGLVTVMLALLGVSLTAPTSATATQTGTVTRLTPAATTSLANSGIHDHGSDSGADDDSVLVSGFQHGDDQIRPPAAGVPNSASTTVLTATTPGGFDGIMHLDQMQSDPGHQGQATPPDQALRAGNGYVLEGVNSAVRVDASDGTPLTAAIATSQL